MFLKKKETRKKGIGGKRKKIEEGRAVIRELSSGPERNRSDSTYTGQQASKSARSIVFGRVELNLTLFGLLSSGLDIVNRTPGRERLSPDGCRCRRLRFWPRKGMLRRENAGQSARRREHDDHLGLVTLLV